MAKVNFLKRLIAALRGREVIRVYLLKELPRVRKSLTLGSIAQPDKNTGSYNPPTICHPLKV